MKPKRKICPDCGKPFYATNGRMERDPLCYSKHTAVKKKIYDAERRKK